MCCVTTGVKSKLTDTHTHTHDVYVCVCVTIFVCVYDNV
jgi:hypothetical protein